MAQPAPKPRLASIVAQQFRGFADSRPPQEAQVRTVLALEAKATPQLGLRRRDCVCAGNYDFLVRVVILVGHQGPALCWRLHHFGLQPYQSAMTCLRSSSGRRDLRRP